MIKHVQDKVEEHYWEADGLNEELLERFIINTCSDSSNSSDNSDSSDSDNDNSSSTSFSSKSSDEVRLFILHLLML